MLRKRKEAPTNIIIIDISNHIPKQQILIQEEPEESESSSWFKIIVLGSIVPLSIMGIFAYLCSHCLSKMLI